MPLPIELFDEPEDDAVVGDIDAFMAYVESGQAAEDWHARMDRQRKELDWLL